MNATMLVVVAVAFVLRILSINYPSFFWSDEEYYFMRSVEVLVSFPTNVNQPPVGFILLAAVFKVFGASLLVGRLVIALLGTASVYYTYLLCRKLNRESGERIGVLAAVIMALEPRQVLWASQVSFYVPMVFFAIAGTYYAYIGIIEHRNWHSVVAGVLLACSGLTKEVGLVFMPILACWIGSRVITQSKGILKSLWETFARYDVMWILGFPTFLYALWRFFISEAIGWTTYPLSFVGIGRATSLLYLKPLSEQYLGILLSILVVISTAIYLIQRYNLVLHSGRKQVVRETLFKSVSVTTVSATGVFGLFALQYLGVLRHHLYFYTLGFWVGALIAFMFLLKLLVFRGEEDLALIWVITTLVFFSFIQAKLMRYLIMISPGLEISSALFISPLIERRGSQKLLVLILLASVILQFLFVDLTMTVPEDHYYIRGLWPL